MSSSLESRPGHRRFISNLDSAAYPTTFSVPTSPALAGRNPTPIPPIIMPSYGDMDGIAGSMSRKPRLQHKSMSIHTSQPAGLGRQSSIKRPLPPVPNPAFASSSSLSAPAETPKSAMRPLPPPPQTPATAPPTMSVSSRPLPPPRWASLRMRVQPLSLSPAPTNDMPMFSPLSPPPPSPMTIKRKRMAKLRKQLGESLPQEVVFGKEDTVLITKVLERPEQSKEPRIVILESALEDSGSSSDEDEDDNAFEQKLHSMGTSVDEIQAGILKHYSTKWIREQGGRRWVEHDVQGILRTLREL